MQVARDCCVKAVACMTWYHSKPSQGKASMYTYRRCPVTSGELPWAAGCPCHLCTHPGLLKVGKVVNVTLLHALATAW